MVTIWRFLFFLLLGDLGAEGHEAKLGELEVLLAEWDADDGDAEDDADDAFNDGEFEAAEDDPDNVQDRMLPKVAVDFLAKRPDDEAGHLPDLLPERDTDDGNAPNQAYKEIGNGHFETAENDPDDVSDSFHIFSPFDWIIKSKHYTNNVCVDFYWFD